MTGLALSSSRRGALTAVLGITAGNTLWLGVTLGGAHLLLERAPGLLTGLRVVGTLYLGWLGLRALRAAWRGGDLMTRVDGAAAVGSSAFRAGVVTSLTNPNTFPFYLTLLGVTVLPDVPGWVRYVAAGVVLACCLLWYGLLAVGFSSPAVQAAYRRWARGVNLLLALLLLLFALRLIWPVIHPPASN